MDMSDENSAYPNFQRPEASALRPSSNPIYDFRLSYIPDSRGQQAPPQSVLHHRAKQPAENPNFIIALQKVTTPEETLPSHPQNNQSNRNLENKIPSPIIPPSEIRLEFFL
ncbi:hypothetical protein VTN49DRAFT_7071 [Thermomyces lanuginosus]|uniref:uncharacterized protein n=1 Tax=Thermomyces lanuginosus TaxID=5541 RepID=UPI003743DFD3